MEELAATPLCSIWGPSTGTSSLAKRGGESMRASEGRFGFEF